MTELMLATADTDFEQRVRIAFERRASTVSSATGATTVDDHRPHDQRPARARATRSRRHRAGHRRTDAALEFARAIDHDRPDISIVIVAEPSANLLQSALRAGARDVIAPDTHRRRLARSVRARARRRRVTDAARSTATTKRQSTRHTCHLCAVPEGRRREDHALEQPRASGSPELVTGRRW